MRSRILSQNDEALRASGARLLDNTDTLDMKAEKDRWAIVIIDYNGVEDTLKCLGSLESLHGGPPAVIVVDNGSDPATHERVQRAAAWTNVIRSDENTGWAGGNNIGIRQALETSADFLLLLNNDTVVDPGLIDRLTQVADKHPKLGVFSPIICYMDEPEVVNADGCRLYDVGEGFFARQPVKESQQDPPVFEKTQLVNGCCFAVRADVFRKVGLIDERFFLVHEESEFCLRAAQAGHDCGVLPEKLVWHKGSSSFAREGKPWQRYFDARNLCLLLKKHRRALKMPFFKTWRNYFRRVYYMYCVQMDADNRAAADAILDGFVDGLFGQYGPWRDRPSSFGSGVEQIVRNASRKAKGNVALTVPPL